MARNHSVHAYGPRWGTAAHFCKQGMGGQGGTRPASGNAEAAYLQDTELPACAKIERSAHWPWPRHYMTRPRPSLTLLLLAAAVADERARIAEQASAMREQMTPEQMEAQMAAQDALANAEAGEVRKTVMGEGPTPTRYAGLRLELSTSKIANLPRTLH